MGNQAKEPGLAAGSPPRQGKAAQPGPGPQALASLPEKVPPPLREGKKPGEDQLLVKKKKASITHPPHKHQLRTYSIPRTVSSNKKNTDQASALPE